jgi:hypothetical protein
MTRALLQQLERQQMLAREKAVIDNLPDILRTEALAQPEPVDVRAAFESHFGAIPKGCVWNGRGFSLTAFNAWEATNYANLFKGFAAAWGVAPPAPDARTCAFPVESGSKPVAWLMTTPELGNRIYIDDPVEAARFAGMDNRTVTPLYMAPPAPKGDKS